MYALLLALFPASVGDVVHAFHPFQVVQDPLILFLVLRVLVLEAERFQAYVLEFVRPLLLIHPLVPLNLLVGYCVLGLFVAILVILIGQASVQLLLLRPRLLLAHQRVGEVELVLLLYEYALIVRLAPQKTTQGIESYVRQSKYGRETYR